jgi:hypothetical protein
MSAGAGEPTSLRRLGPAGPVRGGLDALHAGKVDPEQSLPLAQRIEIVPRRQCELPVGGGQQPLCGCMIGLAVEHLLQVPVRILQAAERIAARRQQEHARHMRWHGFQSALAVSLYRFRIARLECGRSAQVVGQPVAGPLGEKLIEQRIRYRVVARRDQRLSERKTRRDAVRRRLELPAVVVESIGVRAALKGEIATQAEQDRVIRRNVQRIGEH